MAFNYLYQCEVCANSYTCVIPLSKSHQVLIERLYFVLRLHKSFNDLPEFACTYCIGKLEIFDNLISELINGRKHFRRSNETMHQNIHEVPERKAESNPDLHPYNCQCSECRDKFGSLPLLAEVIEQTQKEELGVDSLAGLAVPSTSYGLAPRSSSPKQGSKEMKCSYCDKSFTHRGDLNKHVRTHTGEQPFTCHICDRKFTHTSNLTRHIKVHSGDKPFKCNVCGKQFSRKDKLENHKKTKLCKKYSRGNFDT